MSDQQRPAFTLSKAGEDAVGDGTVDLPSSIGATPSRIAAGDVFTVDPAAADEVKASPLFKRAKPEDAEPDAATFDPPPLPLNDPHLRAEAEADEELDGEYDERDQETPGGDPPAGDNDSAEPGNTQETNAR